MSYSWFRQGTCTVSASDVVRFQGANITTAPNKPVVGDAFTVGGFRFYEIIFIGSDATGEYIRINRAYEEAAGSNVFYAIARFASGTQNAKLVAMASAAINQKQISLDDMYEWYTSQADTVQFLGPDGTLTTLTTYFKLSQEITDVGGNAGAITAVANNINDVKTVAANIAVVNLVAPSIPAIDTVNTNMPAIVAINAEMVSVKNVSDNMEDVKDAKNQADRAESEADRAAAAAASNFAMSQAQFESNRNANKELYAASGWVSLGNHESAKQVNECKPGLYTALTTPNTLLIGKSGGVGGSKTDNAVVHIDGVVFNLTNQFVLTLPSHPISVLPERMDMYGVESEKVEISSAAPNAYQGGLRGVGAEVNLFTATDQQKKDFFAQNSNTTFIGSDGKIYQYQLYKIAFAGTTGGVPSPDEQGYSLNSFGDLWLKADKNLLYFGNVLRLNDGGYHPSFNPLGAAKFVGDTFWNDTTAIINSKADCFDPDKMLTGSGSIASGKSGRPDERYYDAIYADGFGGVCRDMRYPASRITDIEYAEAEIQIESGRYRGFEHPQITKISFVSKTGESEFNPGGGYSRINFPLGTINSEFVGNVNFRHKDAWLLNETDLLIYRVERFFAAEAGSDRVYILNDDGTVISSAPNSSGPWALVYSVDMPYMVGGSFTQTDVFGQLNKIWFTQELSNGWLGKYITTSPRPALAKYELARKNIINNFIAREYTFDNGSNWSTGTSFEPYISIENGWEVVDSEFTIHIFHYKAFAKQTEPANNGKVYGGTRGISDVFASGAGVAGVGALLSESMFSSFSKHALTGKTASNFTLTSNSLAPEFGFMWGVADSPVPYMGDTAHTAINLDGVTGNVGFKALAYRYADNSKFAFIQFAATEMKHNGSNWGDDSKITIVNNEASKPDLNGNIVKVVTHRIKEPLGRVGR